MTSMSGCGLRAQKRCCRLPRYPAFFGQSLKGQPGGSAFNADIGTELPPAIELRPVPDELAARVPQTKDYRYAVMHDRVLLVGTSRIVAGVFADDNVPVGEGRRGP